MIEKDVLGEMHYVCLGMRVYGGSFAKALGEALSCADKENATKIMHTWLELWEQYLLMGKGLHMARKLREKKEMPG